MELFLSQVEKDLIEMSKTTLGYSNFSKEEWQSLRSLVDDRNIVIKKADKDSCVVVWDRNDYIAEAEKQLNNKSVYKNVTFKEKILQDLAETSNNIFKTLRGKGKITEKQLKYFTIAHKKATNLERRIYYLKFTKDFSMFQADQLYRTVACLQKRFQSFWIVILKYYARRLVLYKIFEWFYK